MTDTSDPLKAFKEFMKFWSNVSVLKAEPLEMSYDRADVPSSNDFSGWETTLTDPRQHAPDRFRYLVHAVVPPDSVVDFMQKRFVIEERREDPTISQLNISLLETPERIADKPLLSASLIDQEHRSTWMPGGYILRAPLETILQTWCTDRGTAFVKGERIRQRFLLEREWKGIADPNAVLANTSHLQHNEIVLTGTAETGQKVEITGVFVKVFPDGEYRSEELAERLTTIAHAYGWPVIHIQEAYEPYVDSPPTVSSESRWFGFNKEGRRYFFGLTEERCVVMEYGGTKQRAMTPTERGLALRHVQEYLSTNPSSELAAMVQEAERVPDDVLERRVEKEQRYRKPKIHGGYTIRSFFK